MLPRISKIEGTDADYLLFSTGDIISNALFRTGKWEEHLIEISKFIISDVDQPLIIDIGANLGAYSIPLAKHIQKSGGKVIGFEPQRIVYYQLCGNVIINRLDNYDAIYSAVGEEAGFIEIPEIDYNKNNNIGAFSIEQRFRELHGIEGSLKESSRKVPIIKLDDLDVDRAPSLIKIDVEGLELNILKGGRDFLARNNYPPLLFEAWDFEWFKDNKMQLLSFISELGYVTTNFGASDYLAQHPSHAREIVFNTDDSDTITMSRLR